MSAFATLYGISRLTNEKLRVGINFNQFQFFAKAFPYFVKNFRDHLMDSWYCKTKPTQFQWKKIGNDNYT